MTNKTPESYINDNTRIAGGMINTAGLYTTIESVLHYSETLGIFTDKQGIIRRFYGQPNKSLRKKMNYGKAMSKSFKIASGWLNIAGMGISAWQCFAAETIDDKIKYGADFFVGGIGFAPGGIIISTFWFLGGRELVFHYGEIMGELMKDGINPGLPANQPFK